MTTLLDIAVIGSGPAGLSAAAHAAELGVSHVLLETQDHASHTIYKYQRGKHVMAEPPVLPLRSPMSFEAGTREHILGTWDDQLKKYGVNIQYGQEVTAITGADGAFEIRTKKGDVFQARKVILSIGVQGNLRTLGVEGETLEGIQYQLDDPKEYSDETIVVVGAGDAGIENALGLAEQNTVILLNRNEEFVGVKDGNVALIQDAAKSGLVEIRSGTSAVKVEPGSGETRLRFHVKTPNGPDVIDCHRIIARLGGIPPRKLVESFGVVFTSGDRAALPALSDTYESSVKGLFIIGALGGYPLIKQAMNQGYEAVETALGRTVEPADEPLLAKTFESVPGKPSVAEVLDLLQDNVPLLAMVNRLQLREFLVDSAIHSLAEGEVVCRYNDYTNSLYMIVRGEVRVQRPGGGDIPLSAGEFFGELGLVSGRRRSSTVLAGPDCLLLEAPRRAMLKLMAGAPAVKGFIDLIFARRAVQNDLAPMLTEQELDDLTAPGLSVKVFGGGDLIYAEGDPSDGIHLVRSGSVMLSRKVGGRDVVIRYVPAGNYYSVPGVLLDTPRTFTARAAVNTEVIVLDKARCHAAMRRNPAWRESLQKHLIDIQRIDAEMGSEPERGDVMQFLLKEGVGEATDVLLIDESLCVRCDNCEKACADAHDGTSRLDREAGPTFANVHVPTSCRHCEHPHCMKDCPPDALTRAINGEVFVNDRCIGCGNCERNCPYGVIQMAAVNPKRRRPSLWSWLVLGLGPEPGLEPHVKDKDAPKKAVKCDMCKDIPGGAACVQACPTGAAMRVSPRQFFGVAKQGTAALNNS